jgi:hypothetical protein
MDVEDLIVAIRKCQVRITDHADEEAAEDGLTFDEIYFSVMHGARKSGSEHRFC